MPKFVPFTAIVASMLFAGSAVAGPTIYVDDCATQPEAKTINISAKKPANAKEDGDKEKMNMMVKSAVCVLRPVGDSGVEGIILFEKKGKKVHVTGLVSGLTPGKHGFHIHEFGDLRAPEDGKSAGGHLNPTGAPHGAEDAEERHEGDLGNIEANEEGRGRVDKMDDVIKLNGKMSILGRSIVVHADEDKFTQPTGDAGPRVAFGVIGVANPEHTALEK